MMHREEDGNEEDFNEQDLPWFPGCDLMDFMIRDQRDELKKENEGEKPKHPDDPFRHP